MNFQGRKYVSDEIGFRYVFLRVSSNIWVAQSAFQGVVQFDNCKLRLGGRYKIDKKSWHARYCSSAHGEVLIAWVGCKFICFVRISLSLMADYSDLVSCRRNLLSDFGWDVTLTGTVLARWREKIWQASWRSHHDRYVSNRWSITCLHWWTYAHM